MFTRLFLAHPREKGMTYLQHAVHSLAFSAKLAKGSLKAFTHAFIPAFYDNSTTELNKSLTKQFENANFENANSECGEIIQNKR